MKNKLRLIFAIAWKDILDGFKNKIVLTTVITALFLALFYRYMPNLTRADALPRLIVLKKGSSQKLTDLELNPYLDLQTADTEETFMDLIRDLETPGMGIILDAESGSITATTLTLEGYVPYWMDAETIANTRAVFESELTGVLGKEVSISTNSSSLVYPLMSSYAFGKTFLNSTALLISIILVGLSMAPQLIVEEKESGTLRALMVSPVSFGEFILGKSLAVAFYCLVTIGISLIFTSSLVLDWGMLLLAVIIGMAAIITPGIFLGIKIKDKQQITIWIWVIFIPTILPLFFSIVRVLPDPLMTLVDWWPTVALLRLLRAGFTLKPPLRTIGLEALYLLGITVLFFFLAHRAIRRQTV